MISLNSLISQLERLGGRVIAANDEFFAPEGKPAKAVRSRFLSKENSRTRGHWMDGWETRRRRTPGCDWCIIRLGLPGILRGVVVDTSFFTGNFPAHFSLEGCEVGGAAAIQGRSENNSRALDREVDGAPAGN